MKLFRENMNKNDWFLIRHLTLIALAYIYWTRSHWYQRWSSRISRFLFSLKIQSPPQLFIEIAMLLFFHILSLFYCYLQIKFCLVFGFTPYTPFYLRLLCFEIGYCEGSEDIDGERSEWLRLAIDSILLA